eukprot:TRINITY_DN88_c0_g2_i1.p1 TRINITY_DN88_c0_g2~~TRINITY_DN88_c0_g2_i1.p1  ORF type:complete len:126 (+),score=57.31 TRINITY_DN88_c0_g2_i1:376-753(+)
MADAKPLKSILKKGDEPVGPKKSASLAIDDSVEEEKEVRKTPKKYAIEGKDGMRVKDGSQLLDKNGDAIAVKASGGGGGSKEKQQMISRPKKVVEEAPPPAPVKEEEKKKEKKGLFGFGKRKEKK